MSLVTTWSITITASKSQMKTLRKSSIILKLYLMIILFSTWIIWGGLQIQERKNAQSCSAPLIITITKNIVTFWSYHWLWIIISKLPLKLPPDARECYPPAGGGIIAISWCSSILCAHKAPEAMAAKKILTS